MAATGYTPIQLYYSTTAAAVPVNTNLANGELAINITDGILYYKDNSNVVQILAKKGGNGVTTFSAGTTGLTPSTATSGAVTLAGTLVVANGGTGQTSFTAGRIHYGSFSTSANLFWDASNNRLGVNTSSPSVTAAFIGTDAIQLPVGSTGQQPAGSAGMLRFNNSSSQFEGYNGSVWGTIGGGAAISNDTSTASNLYPLFAAATSGNPTTIYTSNANYLYKPSTGELQSLEVVATNGLFVNNLTVSANYTIPSGYSATSVGPISTNTGIAVTVPSGSRWVVL